MGRQAVRQGVAEYLQGLNLPFVGTIYVGQPLIAPEEAYDTTLSGLIPLSQNGSSCIIMVDIPYSHRQRETLTGWGANDDSVPHDIHLWVGFANTSGDAIAAQADNDVLADTIVSMIRADPALGNPAVFWDSGLGRTGVDVRQHMPFQSADGTVIFLPLSIEFQAWEWLSGPVPQ